MSNITTGTYSTIRVLIQREVVHIQINRPEANNSINTVFISEVLDVLKNVEDDKNIKVIVFEGLPDNFCTGMDFKGVSERTADSLSADDPDNYFKMLQSFSICSKVIISKVEGKVNAGGIGLVAASDIVIAGEKATFGLSEALFGLLPACVMPFLIRRVGYQKAQWMALTTQGISANKAYQIGLVDEITENLNETLRRNLLRVIRLDTATIMDLKSYMSKLWIINTQTRELAVDKLSSLMRSEKVQSNIKNFVTNGKFPWDK
jgi:polyketide biosynthesis enoyl-CoA hydratase PksH